MHATLGLVLQLSLRLVNKLASTRRMDPAVTRSWHRGVCRILGLRITVEGSCPIGTHLVVSNHVSWLDIPVLGSILQVCFLSKAEVRDWPLMGPLATMADTVYIERGAHGARTAGSQMVARLEKGKSVVLFPEGTTGDGKSVRRFIPRLFMAAIETDSTVQPVAVRYLPSGGTDSVAPFFGGERMRPHMLRVLAEPSIQVRVTLCQPIAPAGDRRRLAELTHNAIRAEIEADLPG